MLSNIVFQSPNETAFSLFGFDVYYYGIILALAIFIGYLVAYSLYKKYYDPEKAKYITEISPYLILIGIVGARLYYCCVNFSYYIKHPIEIFYIRQGGLSIHGMILAGIIALYIFSRKYIMKFSQLADTFLCGSILAQSIGRWGNFFNSEAFGLPTSLPWKLYIPPSHRPIEYINFEYFHPTFLYESILDFLIFLILLICFKKLSKNSGTTACVCLILYSLARIFVEAYRIDSVLSIKGYPIAQIVSVLTIFLSSLLLIKITCFKIK